MSIQCLPTYPVITSVFLSCYFSRSVSSFLSAVVMFVFFLLSDLQFGGTPAKKWVGFPDILNWAQSKRLLSIRFYHRSISHNESWFSISYFVRVRQAGAPVESAGREEANRRERLAVKDHVHQHQLDSHHPSHGTCTHARPSDGKLKAIFTCTSHSGFVFLMGQSVYRYMCTSSYTSVFTNIG